MSENSKIEVLVAAGKSDETVVEAGLARRKLIRAGLAVAPVMLGLKSQSALATGNIHCMPSVWSSLKGAQGCHASHTVDHGGNTCHHYTYWKLQTHPKCDTFYHQEPVTNNHVYFGGVDCNKVTNYSSYVPTLKEVCSGQFTNRVKTTTGWDRRGAPNQWTTTSPTITTGDADKDLLAKHCSAMYLNAAVDGQCPLNATTIKSVWNSCKDGGNWTPPSGGNSWSRKDCIEYFEYVCKGTKPTSWTWNAQCA